jgi:hypothetical protein
MTESMSVDDGGGRERKMPVHYPSNSRKSREEDPPEKRHVEKVVTGEVSRRKRSPFAKLTSTFIAEDSGSVVEYLLTEVLMPAAKSLVLDIFTQGLERKLYGESRPRSQAQRGYINYAARSQQNRQTTGNVTQLSRNQRAQHDFSDVILANRADAEDVLDAMRQLIVEYGVATVNDFYEAIGLTGDFTDDKWGWSDLRGASIRMVRGGYMFILPRTQPIT